MFQLVWLFSAVSLNTAVPVRVPAAAVSLPAAVAMLVPAAAAAATEAAVMSATRAEIVETIVLTPEVRRTASPTRALASVSATVNE